MNIVLWILQVLLAFVFLSHAYLMAAAPPAQSAQMPYIAAIPANYRRLLGVLEGLGGLGLVLPALTRILPVLVPWAAIGLIILMASAVVFHWRRHENQNIAFNSILLVLSAIVAFGRFFIAPF